MRHYAASGPSHGSLGRFDAYAAAQAENDLPRRAGRCRKLFGKRIKLMAPLLKARKSALKAENAVDFSGLIHQAADPRKKGVFISPWGSMSGRFQDISPQQQAALC